MYPFIRAALHLYRARRLPPLRIGEEHVTHIRILPWDLDFAKELNNGRTLTLMDLGRLPSFFRLGFFEHIYKQGMFATMAGANVRWRRRVTLFQRLQLRTRWIGWDDRFFYVEQAMTRPDGEVANHAIYRVAVAGKGGIVPPSTVVGLLGQDLPQPDLPPWVRAWAEAETLRPWPPMRDVPQQ